MSEEKSEEKSWRVTFSDGAKGTCDPHDYQDGTWHALLALSNGHCVDDEGRSAEHAVRSAAALYCERQWDDHDKDVFVVDVVPPGEFTRAELMAIADRAAGMAARQTRMLEARVTTQDAIDLIVMALLDDATQAPNLAEWSGRYKGRGFTVSVQWADGKTASTLLTEEKAESARLRARIEGRTVAPTEAEVRAHAAARGRWLISHEREAGRRLVYTLDAGWEDALGEVRRPSPGTRWWALDACGALCDWPMAEVTRVG